MTAAGVNKPDHLDKNEAGHFARRAGIHAGIPAQSFM